MAATETSIAGTVRITDPEALKRQRLVSVLDHAAETVPFYRNSEVGRNRELSFSRWPILSKKRFIDNLDDMLSDVYSDYARVHDPAEVKNPKTLIYEFTSGSSGYPLRCYKTIPERTRLALSLFKKRTAVYKEFSNDQMFGFIHNTEFVNNTYSDSLGNLSEENIEKVLTYLRDVKKPKVLHGNTMVFIYYADFIRKHNFALGDWRIVFIECVSESISAEQKQYVEETFGTEVFNCYGCLECYNVAYDCRYHHLHLNENVIVEIIGTNTGEDLSATGREGEVILTSLIDRAQPFIRYKTGDLASLATEQCACGDPATVINLSGRRKIDYVKLLYSNRDPKLMICGYDIFATVMYRIVTADHDYVSWYNVIQTGLGAFQVLYIKKNNFSEEFYRLFKQYAVEELGMPVQIEFIEKHEAEVLLINQKNRVFRSLLQND